MHVLGVFAKQPLAGAVKTRLAAATSPAWAAQVAAALLADTLQRAATVPVERVIAFAPADAADWFAQAAQGRFTLQAQTGGDLGQRLRSFFEAQQRRGADGTVVIGTDSPTLPVEFIEQAFRQLESADVVLGPAPDGGYYLIGCGPRLPPVFDGVEWSSTRVLGETVRRLDDPSWRLALLPPWYDVDTLADWQMLCGHLAALRRASIDPGVPHTEALASRGRQPPDFVQVESGG
jgi:rSAM/selenodomain-associated transferase 1